MDGASHNRRNSICILFHGSNHRRRRRHDPDRTLPAVCPAHSGRVRAQPVDHRRLDRAHTDIRPDILLDSLPARSADGPGGALKAEKDRLPPLQTGGMASHSALRHIPDPDRLGNHTAAMDRTGWNILRNHRQHTLAQNRARHRGGPDSRRRGHNHRMATRTLDMQHRMPGRNNPRNHRTTQHHAHRHQHRPMHPMPPMRTRLQSRMYRHAEPHGRHEPLRGMLQLPAGMP